MRRFSAPSQPVCVGAVAAAAGSGAAFLGSVSAGMCRAVAAGAGSGAAFLGSVSAGMCRCCCSAAGSGAAFLGSVSAGMCRRCCSSCRQWCGVSRLRLSRYVSALLQQLQAVVRRFSAPSQPVCVGAVAAAAGSGAAALLGTDAVH